MKTIMPRGAKGAAALALAATAAASAMHATLGHEGPWACLPEIALAIAATAGSARVALRRPEGAR